MPSTADFIGEVLPEAVEETIPPKDFNCKLCRKHWISGRFECNKYDIDIFCVEKLVRDYKSIIVAFKS
jgi:hypothetical protein